eukprot:TRINITY_DN5084_c0_g2_i1.p1 TRINITY_DN5084_c0_g2~~TRINITY_DN5084_c0_g2_i1.p1  ORF type:complete len:694 (-),score=119.01 TRINITY_DN5084_c0_g2_i1:253-2334(-)
MDSLAVNIVSFVAEALVVFVVVALILKRYVSFTNTNKFVYFSAWIGYFFSIAILFLVPIDIGITTYLSCMSSNYTVTDNECSKPFNYIDEFYLEVLWNIVYWTTFVCTWALYPIMQTYVTSGEFHPKRKLLSAIKENLIFYAIGAVVLVIVFVVLCIIKQGLAGALHTAIVASNMWGIFVLICLLGYGFVHIPRSLWRKANRNVALKYCQFRLVSLREDIENVAIDVEDTLKLIKKYDETIESDDPNREFLDKILQIVPEEYFLLKRGEGDVINEYKEYVRLNARLASDLHRYVTTKCLFDETFKEAIYLQDIILSPNGDARRRYEADIIRIYGKVIGSIINFKDRTWQKISPFTFRLLAVLLGIMSFLLVVSEVTLPFLTTLNVHYWLVWLSKDNLLILEITSFILISFVGACAYVSLFEIKFFNYYQLLPHQRTDEYSILFSAAYLCRLVAPLCLNFLHLIGYGDKTESPFMQTMVNKEEDDPFQAAVYAYFPIVIVLLCLINIFNVTNKILALCDIKRFQYSEDFNDDQISQGQAILLKERDARAKGLTTLRKLVPEGLLEKRIRARQKRDKGDVENGDKEDKEDKEEDEFFDDRPEEAPIQSSTEKFFGIFSSVKTSLFDKISSALPKKSDNDPTTKEELLQDEEMSSTSPSINKTPPPKPKKTTTSNKKGDVDSSFLSEQYDFKHSFM